MRQSSTARSALALLLLPSLVLAAGHDKTYIGGNMGSWYVGSNWDPNAVPDGSDCAWVNNGLTVAMDRPGLTAGALELHVGTDASHNGSVWHSEGVFGCELLVLGDGAGSVGTYTLHSSETVGSPPRTVEVDTMQIGNAGTGTWTQSAGTVMATDIALGVAETANGSWTMTGGKVLAGDLVVGGIGEGQFVNTGATVALDGSATLGSQARGQGTFRLEAGGQLSTHGDLTVGDAGDGTFYHVDGNAAIEGTLWMGCQERSEGTYRLEAGVLETYKTRVGNTTIGEFVHLGGTHDVRQDLIVGGAGVGSYTLHAGALADVGRHLNVGVSGSGEFDHTGGTAAVASVLRVGSASLGGTGTYTMRAGTLSAVGGIEVEKGTFAWHGGDIFTPEFDLTAATTLRMAYSFDAWDLQEGLLFNGGDPHFPASVSGLGGAVVEVTGFSAATHSQGAIYFGELVLGTGLGQGTYTLSGTGDLWAGTLTIGKTGSGWLSFNDPGSELFVGTALVGESGTLTLHRDWEHASGGALDVRGEVYGPAATLTIGNAGNLLLRDVGGAAVELARLGLVAHSGSNADQQGGTMTADGIHVGRTCWYEISGGQLFADNGIENDEYIGQSGGRLTLGGLDNTWQFVMTGGMTDAGAVRNLLEMRTPGGAAPPASLAYRGIYTIGSLQFAATTVENQTNLFAGQDAWFRADSLENGALGDVAEEPNAVGGTWRYSGKGTYLFDAADVCIDEVENHRMLIVADSAELAGAATDDALVLTNHARARLILGGDFDEFGGDPAGTPGIRGRVVNFGRFDYYNGQFDAAYEHWTDADGFGQHAGFSAAGGVVNYGTLAPEPYLSFGGGAEGVINYGTLILDHGRLDGDLLRNKPGGQVQTSGFTTLDTTVDNHGVLATADMLIVTGGFYNHGGGLVPLAPGQRLRLDQALVNEGIIQFDGGGAIESAATVVNSEEGLIRMDAGGSIDATVSNSGLLEVRNNANASGAALTTWILEVTANNGVLRIGPHARLHVDDGLSSNGTIELRADDSILAVDRAGGPFTNDGLLKGTGTIEAAVENNGVLRAEYPGGAGAVEHALTFTVRGSTNAGRIEVAADNAVVFSAGLASNDGTIALEGGRFDTSDIDHANDGQISGWGTLSTGLLTNNGQIGVGAGDMHVMGPVQNDGTITVADGSTIVFFDDYAGDGVGGGGKAVFLATLSPGHSPGIAAFGGDVALAGGSALAIEVAECDNADPHDPKYDALDVRGDVSLGGLLALDWLPVVGDPDSKFGGAYDIITYAGKLHGEFTGLAGGIAGAYIAAIDYEADLPGRPDLHAVRLTLHPLLDGDADLDGDVDADDLDALEGGFGGPAAWAEGDFNLDGGADYLDYLAWKRHCGQVAPGGGTVPEPAALALLAAGTVALLRRRRSAGSGR